MGKLVLAVSRFAFGISIFEVILYVQYVLRDEMSFCGKLI